MTAPYSHEPLYETTVSIRLLSTSRTLKRNESAGSITPGHSSASRGIALRGRRLLDQSYRQSAHALFEQLPKP